MTDSTRCGGSGIPGTIKVLVVPGERISTGYFGVPGRDGGMVHVVAGTEPICGTRQHSDAEYQWCSWNVQRDYVECRKCLGICDRLGVQR